VDLKGSFNNTVYTSDRGKRYGECTRNHPI
jgi:hypothetical protein